MNTAKDEIGAMLDNLSDDCALEDARIRDSKNRSRSKVVTGSMPCVGGTELNIRRVRIVEQKGAAPRFVTGEGATIAVETLSFTDIRPIGRREILHARSAPA